jgi:SsrA-binding protein
VQENTNIQNKKARFKYFTQKKYVAGLVLTGLQIKSIRSKNVNIDNAYCNFDSNELFIYNVNFANTHFSKKNNSVKLLLNKKELLKIKKESDNPGITIVPLKIFINQSGFAKIQISISKGKKNYDKRQTIKSREAKINISRIMKNS